MEPGGVSRWVPRVSLGLAVVSVAATVLSLWLYMVNRAQVPVHYLYGDVVAGVLYPCTAAFLLRLQPGNRVGWVFAATGVVGLNALANQYAVWARLVHPDAMSSSGPRFLADLAAWFAGWGWAPELLVPVLLPMLFPDGRLPSRRWRGVVATALGLLVVIIGVLAVTVHPIDASDRVWNPWALTDAVSSLTLVPVALLGLFGCLLAALLSMFRRMRRASGVERERLQWLVLAVVVTVVAAVLTLVLPAGLREPSWVVAISAIPVGVVAAMARSRLFEVDVVLNRTVVYGVLTTVVVLAYVGVAAQVGQIAAQRFGIVAVALLTLLLAVARDRVQRVVDRALFGERRDPYAVVARLGERIDAARDPVQAVEQTIGELRRALRLPFVAVVPDDRTFQPHQAGRRVTETVDVPIAVHGERIAVLVVGRRHAGARFSDQEQSVLRDAGRRVGALLQAAMLVEDLRRSRERIVAAREEERRRLRHDLHDGVGPQLAGLALQLDSLARRVAADADNAALVERLRGQLRETVVEVRRVVDDLRPPALDDVGLLEALRQQVRGFRSGSSGEDGLRVEVLGDDLPPLPAAVEVAAFRIAVEAVTNVVRHARAGSCTIRLGIEDGELMVDVRDDGRGMDPAAGRGVGMSSMAERAQEVGGRLTVLGTTDGTTVSAVLPLLQGVAS